MKKIEAIIRPEKLDAIRRALDGAGCTGMSISEIEGHGTQKGIVQQWRGEKYRIELLPKIKIEIVIKDGDVGKIVELIRQTARTGEIGDGKIFVYPIEDVFKIRTGERGGEALG
jgi:nitrogen regulatory protein P-II 1